MHETKSISLEPNLETAISFYREDYHQLVQFNIENCISTGESFDF